MDAPGFSPVKAGDVGVWAHVIDKKTGLPKTDQSFDWDCYTVVRNPPITNAAGKMQFDGISIMDGGEGTKYDDVFTYDDKTGEWIPSYGGCRGHAIHFFDPTILTAKNMKSSNSELKANFLEKETPGKSKAHAEAWAETETQAKVGELLTIYTKAVWPDGSISFFRQPTTYIVTKSAYKIVSKSKITTSKGLRTCRQVEIRMDTKSSTGENVIFIRNYWNDVGMWFVHDRCEYFVHSKEK
jgi:hypothetical protein